MSDLVSKVLAGGLSAALFLFWWPTTVPGSGAEWLLLRGILWALVFELLLVAFYPLERAVTGAIRRRALRGLPARQGARALGLAVAGLAIPVVLLHGAQPERSSARAAAPAPAKERVIVKREVVRREAIVKRVNKYVPVTVPARTTTVDVAAAPARRASTRTRSTAPAKKSEVVVEAPAPTTAPATASTSSGPPAAATSPAPASTPTATPTATSTAPSPAAAPAG
jgi:hypothetical protein